MKKFIFYHQLHKSYYITFELIVNLTIQE